MNGLSYSRRLLAAACLGLAGLNASAYPSGLLQYGERSLLAPPDSYFRDELRQLKLPESRLTAVDSGYHHAATNLLIELADLRQALARTGMNADEADRTIQAHLAARSAVSNYLSRLENWRYANPGLRGPDAPAASPPAMPPIAFAPGLPPEFSDYFEGSLHWHNAVVTDKSPARSAWERILDRPADQRHFKSVWAAFMLGRSWEKEDPDRAIEYFRQTRTLSTRGFSDRLGLAAASLGQEARVWLTRSNEARAIELYMDQYATGDQSAESSLIFVTRNLVRKGEAALRPLADHPDIRRVITAYITSTRALQDSVAEPEDPAAAVRGWLDTVKATGSADAELSEALALAAYQNEQWDVAQYWINRSEQSPFARWLQTRLLLRSGKAAESTRLLAQLTVDLAPGVEAGDPIPGLLGRLAVRGGSRSLSLDQMRGEIGIYCLSRGDYPRALDLFLRAGFWLDAAYVAERVLTLDELKTFVDRIPAAHSNAQPGARAGNFHEQLRHLLARRLTRELRGVEAREYYPWSMRNTFDGFLAVLNEGWNEGLPPEQRARALVKAAESARTNGLVLMGTELFPDWHVWQGWSEGFLVRSQPGEWRSFTVSQDEQQRVQRHRPDPDTRFHYRYQAAFLAWEAAQLMPDNSEETARVLCLAGTWLKYLDPPTADLFYKSMVNRNRATAMGDEADRIRWFPRLDDTGNWLPRISIARSPVDEGE